MMCCKRTLPLITATVLAGLIVAWPPPTALADDAAGTVLRVATFRCDATPVLDGSYYGGWMQPLVTQEAPLWAKGVVLETADGRYVLCALDWCSLWNSAHTMFCQKLAEAADTDISRVAVQCVHQHTAPFVDRDAQLLLDQQENPPRFADLANLEEIADRLAAAVKESLQAMQPVDRVGMGQARVEQVAANRRVPGPDGGIRVRWSTCGDADLRAQPEGDIDPLLKTVTLAQGSVPLVRLHYYATHPQSGGGDGRVGIDFVGDAREQLERDENVPQIYFTGCAGDITVGKYNDGSPAVRPQLADRLLAAMRQSIQATRSVPVRRVSWSSLPVDLPPRVEPDAALAEHRRILGDREASPKARWEAASSLAFQQRDSHTIRLSLLTLEDVRILHLPGEPMLAFQQAAQQLAPNSFVAVAGYGDGDTGYVCTEESFAQGGYEPTGTRIAPSSEKILRAALEKLLKSSP